MVQIGTLHPLFAGEVTRIDLRRPLPEADVAAIRDGFVRLSVLVFPGQEIDDEAQIASSRHLGPLEATRAGAAGAGSPVIVMSNIGPNGAIAPPTDKQALNNRATRHWHHDSSLKPVPARASLLHAREIPGAGGDTEFASTRAAWAELPPDLQREAWGRVALHDFGWSRSRIAPGLVSERERADWPPVRQAVVLDAGAHGRALYLGANARGIEGMEEDEGRAQIEAQIERLMEHATQPRFVYAHRWRPHDLVLWDNRAVLHRATPFANTTERRHMVCTTVAGEGPTLAA